MKNKRIIIANFSLCQKSGSELYTFELASFLISLGYEVALFCFLPGSISEQARALGATIFTYHDQYAIEAFQPDIVHVHHLPCLYFLAGLKLNGCFIHSILGPSSPFEATPKLVGIDQLLVVSNELKAIAKKVSQETTPIHLFPNWFDDRKFAIHNNEKKLHSQHTTLKKIAVITNHLDPYLKEYLTRLSKLDPGFTWKHFGMPNNSVDISTKLLMPFDAIITIGRTVLVAAAIMKPVFIFDIHGCDGWLTENNFDTIAHSNFSGRAYRIKPSFEEWQELFFKKNITVNLKAIALKVQNNYALSNRIIQLTELYDSCEKPTPHIITARINAYKIEGQAFAEMGRAMTAPCASNTDKKIKSSRARIIWEILKGDRTCSSPE